MDNLIISIFVNQILEEIMSELVLFSKYKIRFSNDVHSLKKVTPDNDQLNIFLLTEENRKYYEEIIKSDIPLIVIKSINEKKIKNRDFFESLVMPFRVLDLEKKIISLLARYKFHKSSLINLSGYVINKNERKIIKNELELELTEKEISFLILFSLIKKPLTKDFVLKNVWNYSSRSETHTVETHIHRLRKKILEKFNDNNFIKNNKKGYYI